jgi:hypothetical protein
MKRSPLPSLPLLHQFRTLPVATTRRIPHLLTTWRTAVATATAATITTSRTTTTTEQVLFLARMIRAIDISSTIFITLLSKLLSSQIYLNYGT